MLTAFIIVSILLTIAICVIGAGIIVIGIQTDKITTYENWVIEFHKDVNNTYTKLKQLDERNIFSRDDEVGFAFSQMVSIMEKLKDKIK
jgi:hypothetical protein